MTNLSLSSRALATSAVVLLAGAAFAGPAAADPGKGNGKGHEKSHDKGTTHASRPSGGSASAKGSSGDPAGNNGTFKVDGLPYSDGMANEAHVTCGFRLKFFGFDEGQTGDITIAGRAPSGSGVVSSRTGVLISDDAVGGGPNDPDALVEYTASDLDLTGLTAHPKQGYHLKVTLSTDTPGGVKHKVFWFQPCESAVGGTVTTTPTAVQGTEESRETGTTAPAQVLGVTLTRPATGTTTADRTEVLGTSLTRSGGLPFTGSNVLALAAAGVLLVALGGGTMSAAAARRVG